MPEDDYLWNQSGSPDPEIVRLEKQLQRFASPPSRLRHRRPVWRWIAIAAGLALSIVAWRTSRPAPESVWQLESGRKLALGEKISTGPSQSASLAAHSVGSLRLAPNSTLQVVRSGPGDQRLALSQGTLHAVIWAPSKSFSVETPAGTSIDLGCAYSLTVEQDGTGLVSVSTGWVAFQAGQQESFIPAGAACRTLPRKGPGLPYFTDASREFTQAIEHWESTGNAEELLSEARPRDAITLWHLLQRTQGAARRQVVLRLSQLLPQVDAAGLERGDPAAITHAWNALGLGTADWWRSWKHPWAG